VTSRIMAVLGAFDTTHRRLSLTKMARVPSFPYPPFTEWSPNWKAGVPCSGPPVNT
jgi:hypothetical protein